MRWRLNLEEMAVDELRRKLLENRVGRFALRQTTAIEEKAEAEMQKLVDDFSGSGHRTEQFAILFASLGAGGAVSVGDLLTTAAVRVQRKFRAERQQKLYQSPGDCRQAHRREVAPTQGAARRAGRSRDDDRLGRPPHPAHLSLASRPRRRKASLRSIELHAARPAVPPPKTRSAAKGAPR